MKILLIEDNRRLAAALKESMKSRYRVEIVSTGGVGVKKAQTGQYGLIILDLSLPDMFGLEACLELRSSGVMVPILILTGESTLANRVTLLNAGADDFLAKPFNLEELTARLAALERRSGIEYQTDSITVGDLTLNKALRQVSRAGVVIPLRRREFEVLEYLLQNRGRAVSRRMIMRNVWESYNERWGNTIDVHIKSLRDKIDRPFGTSIIKTAYGIGYMVDDDL